MKHQLDSCVKMIKEAFLIGGKNISSTCLKAIVIFLDFVKNSSKVPLIGEKSILEITMV